MNELSFLTFLSVIEWHHLGLSCLSLPISSSVTEKWSQVIYAMFEGKEQEAMSFAADVQVQQ